MKCRLELHHWVIPCRSFSFGYLPNVCYVNVFGRVAKHLFACNVHLTIDSEQPEILKKLFSSSCQTRLENHSTWLYGFVFERHSDLLIALHYAFCFLFLFLNIVWHLLTQLVTINPLFSCRPLAKFAPLWKCGVTDKKWCHITTREKKRFTFILFRFFGSFLCCFVVAFLVLYFCFAFLFLFFII